MHTFTFRDHEGDIIESRTFADYAEGMDWAATWRARRDWFSAVHYVDGRFAGWLHR